MDAARFSREIRAAWSLVSDKLSVGRTCIWNSSLSVSAEFRDAALDDENTYAEIYKTGLRISHYNILLSDYSYFQFTFENESSWRLGYFPNPWIAGVTHAEEKLSEWEAAEEFGSLSHEDVSLRMDELEYQGSIPPIRFEFSKCQYREMRHPAAHFHIGRDAENRWPVSLQIGPELFTMLICKQYYNRSWITLSSFGGSIHEDDCIDKLLIQTASNATVVHDFSEEERRAPHFGRNLMATAPAMVSDLGRRSRPARGPG
ncbi:MAG: DUF2290 domain-containing protein [Phenylobacterium sp.]|jgi:hypothetical protein|uniref:DUF2290 domain-containing protein n=1 Tax=Phenylobacterium sp. TaxID=1871053 RepID=UPI0025EF62C7|nr:DUF2290 domain-containing protein [Phenylobacterium sp.]MCA3757360.1 DUF2290 domain-containing protein [Phenylobacterium sp.]MCE3011699.1 DUF2290 domain-containing protein [Pseudomonadota bacterium]